MDERAISGKLIDSLTEIALDLAAAIAILLVGWWLARRAVALIDRLLRRRGFDATVGGFVGNIAYVVLLALVVIAALSRLGIPTASFVAAIGAAGLAIGLALQGSLANFAAGVLLVTFRPCKVGDYVEGAGVAGSVDHISVFSTTLVTPDRRTITVPNAKLLDGPIVNYSTSSTRRLDLVFGVAYDTDLARAQALLSEIVASDPRTLAEPAPQIGVLGFTDSAIEIAVRPHVASADYWPLRFDLNERVKRELEAAGIEIPFPQRVVRVLGTTASGAQGGARGDGGAVGPNA